MGAAARGWLSQDQCGKVLAAVSRATYLLTGAGELIWLITPESPLHRRCVQLPAPLPPQSVDSAFTIRGRSINLESGMKLDFRASHTWEVPVLPVSSGIELDVLPFRFIIVVESFLARETPVGIDLFLRPVVQIAKKQIPMTGFLPDDLLTRKTWLIVERIVRDCLAHDLPGIVNHAEELIGLGEGLTPSGDDFLGGLFFARVLLSRTYPQLHYLEFNNLSKWIDAFQSRTNPISFALLKDNITGHTLEPLNRFGIALLANQPVDYATSAASDLIKVGQSTGWSLLTGFLVGMLLAYPA